MDQCFQDPQSQLSEAASLRDIKKFRQALLSGADPEQVDRNGLTLFEWLCGQPESASFISECIKHGASLSRANPKLEKFPIHFACESLDVGNVEAVASASVQQGLDLNVKYYGQTALTQVSGKVTKDNAQKSCECVRVLVKNGADVNIPDPKDQTPLLLLLKKLTAGDEVRSVIKFILENCVVDLDSFRDGEARKRLKEKCPELEALVKDGKDVTPALLESHLKNRREAAFIKDLEQLISEKGGNVNDLGPSLLETAVEEGLTLAVKELVARGVNVNRYGRGTMSPVKIAALRGHVEILEALLKVPEVQVSDNERTPVLCTVIKKLGEGSKENGRYQRCFDLLISHPGIDVNEKDAVDNTALHFACRYRNKEAVLALLEKNAYIGIQNVLDSIAIDDVDADVLERHFDACVRTNHTRIGDDDFEIELDFSNFSPVSCDRKFKGAKEFHEEIAPLMAIARTKELRHLMTHPLITSFLFVKWHRLFSLFLVNLAVYAVFCVALVVHVVFFYGGTENRGVASLFVLVIVVGLLLLVARELSQFVLSPAKYLRQATNYFEIALIVMTVVVLITNYEGEYSNRTRMIASFTILLAALELSLLISSLPNSFISTHLVMLKRVSMSFMKSLSINSVIILAFAFCFYTLFSGQETPRTNGNSTEGESGGDGESKFNSFIDPGTAIIKTIVMMTGEFEAASINFDVNQSSYFIFLIFVFFMSIVLFNLLNGLAVSDTQVIKAEAEQCHFIEKASTLHRFEKSVLSKDFSFLPRLRDSNLLRFWINNTICVFPHFLPQKKITIYPNAGNRIKIPVARPSADFNGTDTSVLIDGTVEKRELAGSSKICLCQPCGGRCSRMDRKIVKQLMQCIERCRRSREEEQEKAFLQQKILSIESKVAQMETAMAELLSLLRNK